MREIVSKILMLLATSMVLLMSAFPHHHHCSPDESYRHIDFICFASDDPSGSGHDEKCHEPETGHSDKAHDEAGNCRLHGIVTLIERSLQISAYQVFSGAIQPNSIFIKVQFPVLHQGCRTDHSEKPATPGFIRTTGLRAPPYIIIK